MVDTAVLAALPSTAAAPSIIIPAVLAVLMPVDASAILFALSMLFTTLAPLVRPLIAICGAAQPRAIEPASSIGPTLPRSAVPK